MAGRTLHDKPSVERRHAILESVQAGAALGVSAAAAVVANLNS
jgi:hypothetical protein